MYKLNVMIIYYTLLTGTDHQDGPPVWELIKPEEFYPFTVPFSMDGSTKVKLTYYHIGFCIKYYI